MPTRSAPRASAVFARPDRQDGEPRVGGHIYDHEPMAANVTVVAFTRYEPSTFVHFSWDIGRHGRTGPTLSTPARAGSGSRAETPTRPRRAEAPRDHPPVDRRHRRSVALAGAGDRRLPDRPLRHHRCRLPGRRSRDHVRDPATNRVKVFVPAGAAPDARASRRPAAPPGQRTTRPLVCSP